MNTQFFSVVREYVKDITFMSPNTPNLFFTNLKPANVEIQLAVNTSRSDDDLYQVELKAVVTPKSDNTIVYQLSISYFTIVKIEGEGVEDESKLEPLLKVVIPQKMYDSLRALVWNITANSGFPPFMMTDYTFSVNDSSCEEEENDDTESKDDTSDAHSVDNIYPLGYSYLIEEIRHDEEGIKFLDTVTKFTSCTLDTYEDLPLYKYYLRFFRPIEYNHPQSSECEDSFWPFLLQILFDQGEDVMIANNGDSLPDIEFTYKGKKCKVSELSTDELQMITYDLGADALTNTLVDILGQNINEKYYNSLLESEFIEREDLLKLYNCDIMSTDQETIDFVDKLYKKIMHYQTQSLLSGFC